MKIELRLSPEQFEALDQYIEAKAREIVDAAFNKDSYSSEEYRTAYDLIVEDDQ